ncbi:2'-5' RNA ligase family protein [Lapillicoccus jejuensis]|uniref:2'-5' RNA ligase superfamily protein n=1 Tax=Lapillicoccus jejuensis TaxID=402171 RepID=A0A542DYT1_9MICO|nr:2'-5' RNA ligase family protein [Lapillicoccus jejuensis]TQJ08255.1 2'-5' RNA ligase superfamily protein [Lapillicoccus jejuensis]
MTAPATPPAAIGTAATETAVVVLVPEAEPVVAPYRLELDRAAAWGVPAHVTVLYPFVDPVRLDDDVLTRLGAAVRAVPAFDAELTDVAWFGDDVAWLAPDPGAAAAFRALTAAAYGAFPDHPPYGGAHDDAVPHLTLGESAVGGLDAVRAAAEAVSARLPVRTRVHEVAVLAGAAVAGSWSDVHRIALPTGPG